jgi:phage baseplate assembly protein W
VNQEQAMPLTESEKTWLGKGVAFPVGLNSQTGDFRRAEFEESIRQSILIILGTAKGERAMRPDFGCGIYDLVFEPSTSATASKISQVVQEALLLFEPRIDVLNIDVEPEVDADGARLLIAITYEVRATNNVFNLVYPFYLERSPG